VDGEEGGELGGFGGGRGGAVGRWEEDAGVCW
jgi:hypothetical protein